MSLGKYIHLASIHMIILEAHMIFVNLLHRLCSIPLTDLDQSPLHQHVPLSQVLVYILYMILLLLIQCPHFPIPTPFKILFLATIYNNQLFQPHLFILFPGQMLRRGPQLSHTNARIIPLVLSSKTLQSNTLHHHLSHIPWTHNLPLYPVPLY